MKKIIKQLLLLYFLGFSLISYSQEKAIWDYPIKPGTEEWKKIETHKTMVEVCQIPEHILYGINTKNLVTLCLQYPLLYDILVFDNCNDGLKKLFSDFNGIRELSKREEALTYLQDIYLAEIGGFKKKLDSGSDLDIGYTIMNISTIELLLGYSDFNENFSKENHKKTLNILLFGYFEKIKYPESFQGIGFTTNLFARAHVALQIDPTLSKIFDGKEILFSGRSDADLINVLDRLSNKLTK